MSSDNNDEMDNRILCKYGSSCYQKNLTHHGKYKHPPEKRKRSPEKMETTKKVKELNADTPKIDNDNENSTLTEDNISDDILSMVVDQIDNNSQSKERALVTIEERKKFIKDKFLMDMPDDFYKFWDFCTDICKEHPKEAFKQIGLTLVGPYDVLDESFQISAESEEKYLLHWRYYYDPPEFQTIIKGNDTNGFHMGYYRDSPEDKPVFVGTNEANKNCIIESVGGNIFGAMNTYIENMLKTADPFKKISINKLHKLLTTRAKELSINLNKSTPEMEARHRKTVCKTFHQAGIVVAYNRKTEIGYRKLPVNEKELRRILAQIPMLYKENKEKAFTSLQPVLNAATIANDECDFGTGLELGLNLFCHGSECLNNTALNVLKTTYTLLNREAFGKIAEVHLKNRKKGIPFILNSNK